MIPIENILVFCKLYHDWYDLNLQNILIKSMLQNFRLSMILNITKSFYIICV